MFCLHRKLSLGRANKHSDSGLKDRAKAIGVDKWDCLLFVMCSNCGKLMDVDRGSNPFDSLTEEEITYEKKEHAVAKLSPDEQLTLGVKSKYLDRSKVTGPERTFYTTDLYEWDDEG